MCVPLKLRIELIELLETRHVPSELLGNVSALEKAFVEGRRIDRKDSFPRASVWQSFCRITASSREAVVSRETTAMSRSCRAILSARRLFLCSR